MGLRAVTRGGRVWHSRLGIRQCTTCRQHPLPHLLALETHHARMRDCCSQARDSILIRPSLCPPPPPSSLLLRQEPTNETYRKALEMCKKVWHDL